LRELQQLFFPAGQQEDEPLGRPALARRKTPMTAREFTIDLTLPPSERFREFGACHRKLLQRILPRARKELLADLPGYLAFLEGVISGIADSLSAFLRSANRDHPYVQEIEGLAEAAEVDANDLYLANIIYDITAKYGILGWVGCTGFVHGGPPHPLIARNMDWDIPKGIGEHSLVLRYKARGHEFVTVGFPGVTGVISGLSSRGYAITVNQKYSESLEWPAIVMPVLWLVRETLEQATSYDAARRRLCRYRAASPAFYLVCGRQPGESCLIESTGAADEVTRVARGDVQAVSNHSPFEEPAEDVEDGDTYSRLDALQSRAERITRADAELARRALGRWPVCHAATAHQMVLTPATGTMQLRFPLRGERAYSVVRVRR
jgi:hypothetical protein